MQSVGGLERPITIPVNSVSLLGDLVVPKGARGAVLFAHGSGSSRQSVRNRYVAGVLQQAGLATVLMDLLTEEEERIDLHTREFRFDIPLLAARLVGAADWLGAYEATAQLVLGCFGASTGAAAALIAAAERPALVRAVVSRGGRPDLALEVLPRVQAPTLLIVGSYDSDILALNHAASERLAAPKELAIIPGATHLFEEPGTLEEVARLAADWFVRYLVAPQIQG